ncbi:enoyl-CoA hydratase-related protein [Phaeovulum vinaykumarii]|uniref:3-hydroxyacyl-CoA dehydrogenase, C-terminal domain n=1 Tax=Phaeovulum vinaykumarii TaxID=407234 RepID=A0A1N7L7P0_9RHOB|nr:enoyl-CoA hydratase-related protein [Phaeovulum vinaykumarii]SIS69859.1 3-hydroxyacyl-CoA dehydrogenase, C-terminal domain [Phaeovulum vinaykumarii]SOB99273.1 3-hydroxyacyl-CoA dehydrogenase-like protein [Phaeovulum vinaykumarii]
MTAAQSLTRLDLHEGVGVLDIGAGRQTAAPVVSQWIEELGAALDRLEAAPPGALVLRAGAGGWPAVGDPLALGGPLAPGTDGGALAALAARLAVAPFPVVAALSGVVTGAALALALAADLRLAASGTRLHLPESRLAAFPAGGAFVRLIGYCGAARVLGWLDDGGQVEAAAARDSGLFDAEIPPGAVDGAALALARRLLRPQTQTGGDGIGRAIRPRDAGLADPARDLAAITAFAGRGPAGLRRARARIAEVAEAAHLLPEPAAQAFAAVALADLLAAPECRAARHRARAAARIRLAQGAAGRPARLGLWQLGTDSVPLALAALDAGIAVVLGGADPGPVAEALTAIARRHEARVAGGTLSPQTRERLWANVDAGGTPEILSDCDLVLARCALSGPAPQTLVHALGSQTVLALEAGTGRPAFPPACHERPEQGCGGCAAFALSAPGLAEVMALPEDDRPAARMCQRLSRGAQTRALRAFDALGHCAVPVGLAERPLAEGVLFAAIAAAERCVMAGASPAAVDAAVCGWGLAEGPLATADRLGLAPLSAGLRAHGLAPGPLLLMLVADGALGRDAGRGFHDWRDGTARPSEGTADLIAALRAELPPRRTPDAAGIVARVLAECVDLGMRALQSGRVDRPGDLDLISVAALGLGPAHPGIMRAAETAGLAHLHALLAELAQEGARPATELWSVLLRKELQFSDIDAASADV